MWYWLFINSNNQYIVMSDKDIGNEGRWLLEDENFTLINDSFLDYKTASEYAEKMFNSERLKIQVVPISYKAAVQFINANHRHHKAPQGQKFSLGLSDGSKLIGAITAGRPVSRIMDDTLTLEVTRCCVKEIYKNGVSKLYSHVCRVAKAMGYKRVITYTLVSEPGTSMQAANFSLMRKSRGGSWSSKLRKRIDKHPTTEKNLWVRDIS